MLLYELKALRQSLIEISNEDIFNYDNYWKSFEKDKDSFNKLNTSRRSGVHALELVTAYIKLCEIGLKKYGNAFEYSDLYVSVYRNDEHGHIYYNKESTETYYVVPNYGNNHFSVTYYEKSAGTHSKSLVSNSHFKDHIIWSTIDEVELS